MPLTRAVAESMALARGLQSLLSEVAGPSIIPATGAVSSPSAFLGPIIASALAECGVIVADPTDPTDEECGRIGDAARVRFWNALEYYALLSAWTGYSLTEGASSVTLGSATVSSGGASKQMGERIGALAKMLGIGMSRSRGLAVGQIPPYLARPIIPQSQNWPPGGFGGRHGWRG